MNEPGTAALAADAAPCRDPAYRAELGERACMDLMTRADWRTLLEIWAEQQALEMTL